MVMVMVRVRVGVMFRLRVKGDEPAIRAGAIARHSCRRCLLVPFALDIEVLITFDFLLESQGIHA